MFGRQKNFKYYDENDREIGVEAQCIPKGYDSKNLKQLVEYCLEDDELLISFFGKGKPDNNKSDISKKVIIFIIIGLFLTVLGMVLGIFFDVISESDVLKIMFLGFFGMPAAALLIMVIYGSIEKDYNYAITDRRVLAISEGMCMSIRFEDIEHVAVSGEKVILYLKTYSKSGLVYNIVSKDNDPQQVKNVIDNARLKYTKEAKKKNMSNAF